MKIVIVNSTTHVRQNLGALLQRHGHEVIAFANGREALLHLESYGADLLIAADQLPDMPGADVAAHIRRWSSNSAMPVLVLHERDRPSVAVPALSHAPSAPSACHGFHDAEEASTETGDSVFRYLSQVVASA